MGAIRESLFNFAWNLNDRRRGAIYIPLGAGVAVLVSRLLGWTWELSFLLGWILAVGSYLVLQGIVLVNADGPKTRERATKY